MSCTTTTVAAWHQAIIDTYRDAFGDRLAQLGAYDPWTLFNATDSAAGAIATPALLIELEAMTPAAVGSRDRIAVQCTWVAHCILSQRTDDLQLALREIAVAAIGVLDQPDTAEPTARRGNRWGLGTAVEWPTPDSIDAYPGEFAPGLHGHDGWIVRWDQVGYFGDTLAACQAPTA